MPNLKIYSHSQSKQHFTEWTKTRLSRHFSSGKVLSTAQGNVSHFERLDPKDRRKQYNITRKRLFLMLLLTSIKNPESFWILLSNWLLPIKQNYLWLHSWKQAFGFPSISGNMFLPTQPTSRSILHLLYNAVSVSEIIYRYRAREESFK